MSYYKLLNRSLTSKHTPRKLHLTSLTKINNTLKSYIDNMVNKFKRLCYHNNVDITDFKQYIVKYKKRKYNINNNLIYRTLRVNTKYGTIRKCNSFIYTHSCLQYIAVLIQNFNIVLK